MEPVLNLSGTVDTIRETDYGNLRRILVDAGGIILLPDCGEYKEGDRVVVSVRACADGECYLYPKRNLVRNE